MTVEKSRERRVAQGDDEIFKSLTESAFEFLERAVSEFKDSPKFSTIHFATAVELFLKARLMREHWSLVVDDADKTSKAQFLEGRSRTVGPGAAISRLRNIVGLSIGHDAEQTFSTISEHRNKMIHFVHEDDAPGTTSGELFQRTVLEKVAIEQCRGWLQLERLLSEWADHFQPWKDQADKVRESMKGHREFLGAIFERVSPAIDQDRKSGVEFQECDSCTFGAAKVEKIASNIVNASCLVCGATDTNISIDCPGGECGEVISLSSTTGHKRCQRCETEIDASVVAEALDTDQSEYYDHTEKNCAWCGGYHTVVEHDDLYVCTECLEVSENYGICGWCNDGQLGGDLEMSFYSGCEFCDGHSGWHKDD